MYAIKNTVQLVGSIAGRPVIRDGSDGKKFARFSIVIEDSYNNAKGVKVRETQSHMLVAQGRIATLAERCLEKDMMVAIVGRLVNRYFRDSNGVSRSVTEIMVNELLILNMQTGEEAAFYGVETRSEQSLSDSNW